VSLPPQFLATAGSPLGRITHYSDTAIPTRPGSPLLGDDGSDQRADSWRKQPSHYQQFLGRPPKRPYRKPQPERTTNLDRARPRPVGDGLILTPMLMVGRSPWTAADAPVGLLAPYKMLTPLCRRRDEGVPRGPGGPPHQCPLGTGAAISRHRRACGTTNRPASPIPFARTV
jgi:hypothetical protein